MQNYLLLMEWFLSRRWWKIKRGHNSSVKILAKDFVANLTSMTERFKFILMHANLTCWKKKKNEREREREKCWQGKATVQYKTECATNIKHFHGFDHKKKAYLYITISCTSNTWAKIRLPSAIYHISIRWNQKQ